MAKVKNKEIVLKMAGEKQSGIQENPDISAEVLEARIECHEIIIRRNKNYKQQKRMRSEQG